MDPHTTTREQFSASLVFHPIPANATQEWKEIAQVLQKLHERLAHHEVMAPNLQQTYMTPANSKNTVYFMWDFVGRTLGMLYDVPPEGQVQLDEAQKQDWDDVRSRNVMTKSLILDIKPGMLNQLVENTYPGQAGEHPQFGDEILAIVRDL